MVSPSRSFYLQSPEQGRCHHPGQAAAPRYCRRRQTGDQERDAYPGQGAGTGRRGIHRPGQRQKRHPLHGAAGERHEERRQVRGPGARGDTYDLPHTCTLQEGRLPPGDAGRCAHRAHRHPQRGGRRPQGRLRLPLRHGGCRGIATRRHQPVERRQPERTRA